MTTLTEILWLTAGIATVFGPVVPFAIAAILALTRGREVPGRWVYVVLAPLAGYTIALALLLIVGVPLFLISMFLVPAIVAILGVQPFWMPAASLFSHYWWLGTPIVVFALSLWSTFYIWPKWSALYRVLFLKAELPIETPSQSGA